MTIEEIKESVTRQARARGHDLAWTRTGMRHARGPEFAGQCAECGAQIGVSTHGFFVNPRTDPRSTTCKEKS